MMSQLSEHFIFYLSRSAFNTVPHSAQDGHPGQNWLRDICHPLHQPHKSDAVVEWAAMNAMSSAMEALSKLLTNVPHWPSS